MVNEMCGGRPLNSSSLFFDYFQEFLLQLCLYCDKIYGSSNDLRQHGEKVYKLGLLRLQ